MVWRAPNAFYSIRQAPSSGAPNRPIETIAISADGAQVAFTTQLGGSEDETIHVVDVATGKMLGDTLPHAGGGTSPVAMSWDGDGRGFLHTQWPRNADGTYATAGMLIYHHVLGTEPATDTYVFGRGLSAKVEYHLATSLDGTARAVIAADGDGVPASIYLQRGTKPFELVAMPDAGIGGSDDPGGAFVGDAFYAISKKRDSRGEIIALATGRYIRFRSSRRPGIHRRDDTYCAGERRFHDGRHRRRR